MVSGSQLNDAKWGNSSESEGFHFHWQGIDLKLEHPLKRRDPQTSPVYFTDPHRLATTRRGYTDNMDIYRYGKPTSYRYCPQEKPWFSISRCP